MLDRRDYYPSSLVQLDVKKVLSESALPRTEERDCSEFTFWKTWQKKERSKTVKLIEMNMTRQKYQIDYYASSNKRKIGISISKVDSTA